jgi:hypothetical protein
MENEVIPNDNNRTVYSSESRRRLLTIVIGYVRVSTGKQGQKGMSLGDQRQLLDRAGETHKFVIEQIFEDIHSARHEHAGLFSSQYLAVSLTTAAKSSAAR